MSAERSTSPARHYLVIENLGEGEFDRTVEHHPDCPTEVRDHGLLFGQVWEEYICGVGYWESGYGLEDLADDPRFSIPGRYEISFYSYVPASMFEDAEQYLEFVG